MRLHRLELEGFGPFRDRQVVDFDALAPEGIFLISGRTGAGKSSILDGVCFALYGGVPRYEGGEKRLRSDHCAPADPTRVTLEFDAGARTLRVTRSPEYERAKRRGEGTTKVPATAELAELIDGAWVGVAAGARDVGIALDEILGLSQQQFLQVILLAQGRFSQFLLAKNDERQRLLRTLFGTRRFEDYERAWDQRRKETDAQLQRCGDRLAQTFDDLEALAAAHELGAAETDSTARMAFAERAAEKAAYRAQIARGEVERTAQLRDAAATAHAALVRMHEAQSRRERAREQLAALDAQQREIDELRDELAGARAAAALRPVLEALQTRRAAADEASTRHERARDAWTSAGEPIRSAPELRALVDELTGELAVLDRAAHAEQELVRERDALATARNRQQDAARAIERAVRERDEHDAAIAALAETENHAALAAAAGDRARDDRAALHERLAAAHDAQRLGERSRAAVAEAERASRAAAEASAAANALLHRRLAAIAGELAAELVDGEPCAVCGSREHPEPAQRRGEPVTHQDLAAAEERRQEATALESAAAAAATAAVDALAATTARAGGADIAELTDAVSAAQGAVDAAEKAAAERDRARDERARRAGEREQVLAAHGGAQAELIAAREAAAVAEARVDALESEIGALSEGHGSIADAIAVRTSRRERARSLVEAIEDRATADAAADAARADLDRRLQSSTFDGAGAVSAAQRTDDEIASAEHRVQAHAVALRTARQHLLELELELADAPTDPVDLAAARATEQSAREEWTRAVESAARADELAARVRELAQRAAESHRDVAGVAQEHAAIARLADTVAGRPPNTLRMTLETFVLAAELEEIVVAANLRLAQMSAGRYTLAHTDARARRGAASGLGIEILDAFTGRARPAQSLSGGETFLASLALALGLAEVVTARAGGVRLDTLFVDEGFGSLDTETLESAMHALDELRSSGRTVGVISHVEAMKEQLPTQIIVSASSQGPSTIRLAAPATI